MNCFTMSGQGTIMNDTRTMVVFLPAFLNANTLLPLIDEL